ncbi:HPP family protein [Chitiniphilus eburneus]|uniref:HPP family protein n=1 Tax=Chitiniphilus eburneus TaxID=2571148 RepID=A0A4U0Q624_9NEIS|nr:HPP family protein [Chitiniphilus eburneus]TJZ76230.1 HPP family protein [Chitiniphilus eburneus]
MSAALAWFRSFHPAPLAAGWRERLFGCLGAGLGLLLCEWVSRRALGTVNPWFVAPMGASAVLLFAVPASPLAQPWSIVGGNTVSALIGVACGLLLGHNGLAAGLAGALAIGVMFQLRCLHPPGGAVALTAVIGGPAVAAMGWDFVLWPVLVNSALLLLVALVFNNLTHRRYPHGPVPQSKPHRTDDPLPSERGGLTREDLDAALAAHGEPLDITRDDLAELLGQAQALALHRRFGSVRCEDIMSRDVIRVGPDSTLREAWGLLARHKVKALPVTDAQRSLLGIVSLHDFFVEHTAEPRFPTGPFDGERPVSAIMTQRVHSARPDQSIAELVPVFSDGGLHHMPVVDAAGIVVGMLTQSDLVAALAKAG